MHDGGGQGLEETRVVAPRRESFQRRHELVLVVGRFLEIENGVVQVFFTGEVAEQDRFADSGGRGDVLGLGAAESLLRKLSMAALRSWRRRSSPCIRFLDGAVAGIVSTY